MSVLQAGSAASSTTLLTHNPLIFFETDGSVGKKGVHFYASYSFQDLY